MIASTWRTLEQTGVVQALSLLPRSDQHQSVLQSFRSNAGMEKIWSSTTVLRVNSQQIHCECFASSVYTVFTWTFKRAIESHNEPQLLPLPASLAMCHVSDTISFCRFLQPILMLSFFPSTPQAFQKAIKYVIKTSSFSVLCFIIRTSMQFSDIPLF